MAINKAFIMLELLNIDLPHSTWVCGGLTNLQVRTHVHNYSQRVQACCLYHLMLESGSEWVQNQADATILSAVSKGWIDANWQTTLKVFNVTTGPRMKEAM